MEGVIMSVEFPKSDSVDIMLFSEGTYPYVKGGVSAWVLQLIKGLPEFNFGVCFVGASKMVDGRMIEVSYEFPPNLVHLEEHFLFEENEKSSPKKIKGSKEGFEAVESLYESFKDPNTNSEFKVDVIKSRILKNHGCSGIIEIEYRCSACDLKEVHSSVGQGCNL